MSAKLNKHQKRILDLMSLGFKLRYDHDSNHYHIWRFDAWPMDFANRDYSRLINLGLIEKNGADGLVQGGDWYKITRAGMELAEQCAIEVANA